MNRGQTPSINFPDFRAWGQTPAPLALGLMSGTSCDGASAALVRIRGRRLELVAHQTLRYPRELTQRLLNASTLSTAQISSLNVELGDMLARSARRLLRTARVPPRRVAVIGSHGHTVYHGPRDCRPSTLQLGEPSVIAATTGIPVVANFRMRDLAAGGEGAPLVPFFDEFFFGRGPVRALQNIGGIANVTVVGRRIQTVAFDTGPGNCLMDLVAQRLSRGRLPYDRAGRLAARGRIDPQAIRRLWAHPYFRLPPPKSAGRELFNEALLRRIFGARVSRHPRDVLATVTCFTAHAIAESYRRFLPVAPTEVIVSGGGAHNRTLMRHLRQRLAPIPVTTIAAFGLPVQAKEPAAFAFLALRALRRRINHLPRTTGASRACVLGALTR